MNDRDALKEQLKTAFIHTKLLSSQLGGNLPSLVQNAFYREFNCPMNIHHDELHRESSVDDLASILANLGPLSNATAANLIDHARARIPGIPPTSARTRAVRRALDHNQLHTQFYTTIWAILMEADADPDLTDSADRCESPRMEKRYPAHAKCLWFLCKRFFSALTVAEADGRRQSLGSPNQPVHFALFSGRLFARGWNKGSETGVLSVVPVIRSYRRVGVPFVEDHVGSGSNSFIITPKGTYLWGKNEYGELGLGHRNPMLPARMMCPRSPAVAEIRVLMRPWHIHDAVPQALVLRRCGVLNTTAGLIVAGMNDEGQLGLPVDEDKPCVQDFTEIDLPHRMRGARLLIPSPEAERFGVRFGSTVFLPGPNDCGQAGQGHVQRVESFMEVPFDVTWAWLMPKTTVFLTRGRMVLAGRVTPELSPFTPVVEGQNCVTPTTMALPIDTSAAAISDGFICLVRGRTSSGVLVTSDGPVAWTHPAPVTHVIYNTLAGYFLETEGEWTQITAGELMGAELPALDRNLDVSLVPVGV
ncbi:putative chromatin binding protein [Carpediemonas membranifera]|uniref:Putative chromatin binding protein n=1 Tax=Carpediemonas membranifera TaxID=201153 RepID=A0A8J6B953_9EUKA|nr:putative chromatin binding protein [Carpediemonas membranifera]|eukprot:KAG9396799.1 putative chromatin binding protein [Carpediemonas membranifera]